MEVTRLGPIDERQPRRDRLERLYEINADAALRLAHVLTGDRHVAEDLTHEAFVRVGRRLWVLKDGDHARNYLMRTVVNLTKSRSRRLKVERSALQRSDSRVPDDTTPDVTEQDRMWQALIALPARQRAALFLRYYQDLSEAQTAETLQCSVGAVKSLVNRGLKQLRGRLEGDTQ